MLTFGLTTASIAVDFSAIKASANRGDAKARGELARMYEYGDGVQENSELALVWYKLGSQSGDVYSNNWLGHYYLSNDEYLMAFNHFKAASQKDYIPSYHMIAFMHEMGLYVNTDKKEAKKWYKKSCDNHTESACYFYQELDKQGY